SLAISRKYRKVGFMVLGALALGLILGEGILKNIIQRDRPFINMDGIDNIIKAPTSYSFPSGHTTASFAAAGVLAMNFRNKSFYIFTVAILIAFSRLYLGVHFPTDIISGIILGLMCAYISLLIGKRFKEEKTLLT
ncbi:MAG: phosphatase PAP2 family protein, partial [Clostridium sp.]